MIEVGLYEKFPVELKHWHCNQDGTWAIVERNEILIGGLFRPHFESWWQVITYKQVASRNDPKHLINIRDKELQVATLEQAIALFK